MILDTWLLAMLFAGPHALGRPARLQQARQATSPTRPTVGWSRALRAAAAGCEPVRIDGDLVRRESVLVGQLAQPFFTTSEPEAVAVRVAHHEVPHSAGPGGDRVHDVGAGLLVFGAQLVLQGAHAPGPVGDRLRGNAAKLRAFADHHDRTRITLQEPTG